MSHLSIAFFGDDAIALARQQLTPTVATAAWAAGAAMTLDEALGYALAIQ